MLEDESAECDVNVTWLMTELLTVLHRCNSSLHMMDS